ncbi:hypothetical protein F4808DRAFT_48392 [Astrocystis sublimbata]|nr:hypothetical protein F4808DRAFT_445895 [Astrocystis sublimbata]KAI0188846.1 hypothetical protein F4808DRAFT_48392 [Astrocystis sublimbata]
MITKNRKRRSRKGCASCRIRKVKCDERHPVCGGCVRLQFACDWPEPIHATKRAANQDQSPRGTSGTTIKRRTMIEVEGKWCVPPSLGPANIACANSVLLSRNGRLLLSYFPSSLIYYRHTSREWSPLKYVYDVVASSSSMVMHMIMALSALELRQAGFGIGKDASISCRSLELYYYTEALRELQDCLSKGVQYSDDESLDAITATLFFMINYGLSSIDSFAHARTHFAGLKSFLALLQTCPNHVVGPESATRERSGLTPLSSQLLVWLLYADSAGPFGRIIRDILVFFADSEDPNFSLPRLHRASMLGFREFKVGNERTNCLIDIAEYDRLHDFAHRLQPIRAKMWELGTGGELDGAPESYSLLMNELEQLRIDYADFFTSADKHGFGSYSLDHVRTAMIRLLGHYWACLLYCRRWNLPGRRMEHIDSYAVASITKYLREQYAHEERSILHLVWPLFIAATETAIICDRDWMLERLYEFRNTSAECQWNWSVAKETLKGYGDPSDIKPTLCISLI